jgi:hypothetical protein
MTSMPTSPGQGGQPPNRAQLQELIGSMRMTQLIYVAATLGIADQLKEGPKSIAELASTASVDPNALYRVLRALASQGIFVLWSNRNGHLEQGDTIGTGGVR